MKTEIILRQHRRNSAADIIPCICRCVFNRPSLKTPTVPDFTKLCRCVSDKARISQSPKTWLAGICREVEDTPADVLITRWQRLGDYADKRSSASSDCASHRKRRRDCLCLLKRRRKRPCRPSLIRAA